MVGGFNGTEVARAKNSAYSLSISTLAPGTYRLVAFAHSAVTGLFDQSRTRVVTVTGES